MAKKRQVDEGETQIKYGNDMAKTKTKKTRAKPQTPAEWIAWISENIWDVGIELWWLIFVVGIIAFLINQAFQIWRF